MLWIRKMTVLVFLIFSQAQEANARPIEIEGLGKVDVSMPQLANLSAERRKGFEQQFLKEFKIGTADIKGHEKDHPVLPLPIYGPVGFCAGEEVYILNASEVRIKDSKGEVGFDILAVGSAGMPFWIYSSKAKSKMFERKFADSIQEFYGIIDRNRKLDECPSFVVEVHGSHFQRTGSQSGKKIIKFNPANKRFELAKDAS